MAKILVMDDGAQVVDRDQIIGTALRGGEPLEVSLSGLRTRLQRIINRTEQIVQFSVVSEVGGMPIEEAEPISIPPEGSERLEVESGSTVIVNFYQPPIMPAEFGLEEEDDDLDDQAQFERALAQGLIDPEADPFAEAEAEADASLCEIRIIE